MSLTGNTTKLMEQAVSALAELPDTDRVFITGAHTPWLLTLEKEFRIAGLTDVVFVPADSILWGKLRGRSGILLIDDEQDFSNSDLSRLLEEKRCLERR